MSTQKNKTFISIVAKASNPKKPVHFFCPTDTDVYLYIYIYIYIYIYSRLSDYIIHYIRTLGHEGIWGHFSADSFILSFVPDRGDSLASRVSRVGRPAGRRLVGS